MKLEIIVDGRTFVDATIDLDGLLNFNLSTLKVHAVPARSKPIAISEAEYIISHVHENTAVMLREIVANGGSITWKRATEVLGLTGDDWAEFSNGPNRGITRALRFITKDRSARLIWWSDPWDEDDWSNELLSIDGKALDSLKAAFSM